MTNNLLKLEENTLILRAPIAMWSDLLEGVDENWEVYPKPAGSVVREDFTILSDDESDEGRRALVTPEMLAAMDPSQWQMLANLTSEVRKEADPLNSIRLMSRMATAFSFARIALPVILSTVAEAAKESSHYPFHQLYYFGQMSLL